jgi:hypothetical protein
MLEAGVENFLDPAQFGLPGGAQLIETGIHVRAQVSDAGIHLRAQIVNAGVYIANAGIYIAQPRIIDQDSNQDRQAWWEPRLARSIKFGLD